MSGHSKELETAAVRGLEAKQFRHSFEVGS